MTPPPPRKSGPARLRSSLRTCAAMPRPPGAPPGKTKMHGAAHRAFQDCSSTSAQFEQIRCSENLHLFYFLRWGPTILTGAVLPERSTAG